MVVEIELARYVFAYFLTAASSVGKGGGYGYFLELHNPGGNPNV